MSNLAVITLADASKRKGDIKRFVIEDNIGESIHLHIDNMRVDFTIKDFLEFTKFIRSSLKELNLFQKYQLEKLDPHFLFEMSDLIKDIQRVEIQTCRLGDLRALVRVKVPKISDVMLPRQIKCSPAYRFLEGESGCLTEYVQYNYPGVDNVTRLEKLRNSIKKNGYCHESGYIVLFGDQKLIRDGQHRAAILASLGGFDQEIPVMVFHFAGNRWRLKPYRQMTKAILKKVAVSGLQKVKGMLQILGNQG
ncbi:hypothetical protein UWK_02260 [Desulfocapsa sulfexigens DSM 10523]|uniref:Uncharacterized protein n=1 Tax=Desulfocapsa sulfexigens (strain DSM 10523 / SB164P1) TaxID=1167006 RepID=M1PGN0_DESSD|nr:hypothetical protein [Desulfocapsa sulfexigens]AGF78800.1 hypothetical protein UWK_02260 [Desulfocapsa sulfexigens DSM 10523]